MPYLRHILSQYTATIIIVLFGFVLGVFPKCAKEDSCKCKAGVSWSIDLSPLDVEPRPHYSVPVTTSDTLNSTILFHPCTSFWSKNETMGDCGLSGGVAVCLVQDFNDTITYTNLGVHEKNTFATTGSFPNEGVTISYKSLNDKITTTLILKCNSMEKSGKLLLENSSLPNTYSLTLESQYCCANAISSGLSVGSILLILFFVVLLIYLVAGMVYNHFVMGATGFEICPHYEFWIDFPFLVRDGIFFLCRGCRTEPSYDRI